MSDKKTLTPDGYLHDALWQFKSEFPHDYKRILTLVDWQQHAKAELERRILDMITQTDSDVLADFASGSLDISEVLDQLPDIPYPG